MPHSARDPLGKADPNTAAAEPARQRF